MSLKKEKISEQELIRRQKLKKILDIGYNPYFSSFNNNIDFQKLISKYQNKSKAELENLSPKIFHRLAGRIIFIRNQGKAIFMVIKDFTGELQIYLRKDQLIDKNWNLVLQLDIGDIVGIYGSPMRTNRGIFTIKAKKLLILAKALKPLPEKFHGLKDPEEIYRKRYLDLILNKQSQIVFLKRTLIINEIRNFLNRRGFLEFETPILQAQATGAAAKPFKTYHHALKRDFILRIATELHLKRLIVSGFNKVYELGRIFRNEGISIKHNPEFTSIEIYQAYGDLGTMIKITESLIEFVAKKVNGSLDVIYQETKLNLKKPFQKIEMLDLIKQTVGIDFKKVKSLDKAKELAKEHDIALKDHFDSIGYIINEFFEQKCEKELIQPTFVTGYPIEVSPLARRRKNNPNFTDRFELFISGREYANAFSELNDPDDQYMRFLSQVEEKKRGNEEANEMDKDFIEALMYGMPPTGGLGIGIDRLVMLLTDSASIKDVILFPHQKEKK